MGYENLPHKLFLWQKINDIDKLYENHTSKNRLYYDKIMRVHNRITYRKKNNTSGVDVEQVDVFNSEIDDYWLQVSPRYMYSLEKSSEYLNWRYCRDFAGEYNKFIARIDGKTAGYAVVSINIESPMNIVFTVADCCYDSIETGYALLENISNLFDDSNSNVLRMLIPKGHPLERISAEYGMWNTRIHY
jgi:hypothetical protein